MLDDENKITIQKKNDMEAKFSDLERLILLIENNLSEKKLTRENTFSRNLNLREDSFVRISKDDENYREKIQENNTKLQEYQQVSKEHLKEWEFSVQKSCIEQESRYAPLYDGFMDKVLLLAKDLTSNEASHKDCLKERSVLTSRISYTAKDIEEQLSKLFFVQSKNSHNALSNKIQEFSNKVYPTTNIIFI